MDISPVSSFPQASSATRPVPVGAGAVGREFEILFMEVLLRPLDLAVGGRSTSVAADEVWTTVFKSHLAEAIASRHSLGLGQLWVQEQTSVSER